MIGSTDMGRPTGDFDFVGWSEIAAELGVHVDTARAWAKRKGLPVCRYMQWVVAYRRDLRRWQSDQVIRPEDVQPRRKTYTMD